MQKILGNKWFKLIYKILKISFILLIVLYLIFVLFQRFSNNSPVFGYRIFNIASSSMEPLYKIGDAIVVKEVDTTTLKVGDNITYLGKKDDFAGKIVTHSLVKIEKDNKGNTIFHTKGIANQVEDPAIEPNQVYGKAVHKLNLMSVISKTVRNKFGFFFLVFIPLVVVIFLEIADTIVDKMSEKKKKGKNNEDDQTTSSL